MTRHVLSFTMMIILIGALLITSGCRPEKTPTEEPIGKSFVAEDALENYVKFTLNEQNVKDFGFNDLAEARSAEIGGALAKFSLDLNSLKDYTGATPLRKLMKFTGFYYPVTVNGEVRTKLVIAEENGEWIAKDFGGVEPVKIIFDINDKTNALMSEKNVTWSYGPYLVEIPALAVSMFYMQAEYGDYIVPAMIQPERFGLQNGQLYRAQKILPIFRKYAQGIK